MMHSKQPVTPYSSCLGRISSPIECEYAVQAEKARKVNWISDADIKGFFDNVSHEHLLEFLKKRIADPRMLKLIEKFLTAGVMIDGRREDTDQGVPRALSVLRDQ